MNSGIKDKMIGAKLQKIYVNRVEKGGFTLFNIDSVLLETDQGLFKVYVYSECCSQGYIDHIGMPYYLGVGRRTITGFKDIELEGEFAPSSQEEDRVYGLIIELDQDKIFLEYRNSSNGYYGSDYQIEQVDLFIAEEWEEITDSF